MLLMAAEGVGTWWAPSATRFRASEGWATPLSELTRVTEPAASSASLGSGQASVPRQKVKVTAPVGLKEAIESLPTARPCTVEHSAALVIALWAASWIVVEGELLAWLIVSGSQSEVEPLKLLSPA